VCLAHTGGGTSKKGPDNKGIPLCFYCHTSSSDSEHVIGHRTFKINLLDNTGKTWEEHAKATHKRYQMETGRK